MEYSAPTLSRLIQRFFRERLMEQKKVSQNTIDSYNTTFQLLLMFAKRKLNILPSRLELWQLDAPFIAAFLNELENDRKNSARTRNLRLTCIRSFFNYLSIEEPSYGAHIQRVLSIPSKRYKRRLVSFLTQPEVNALLAAPDQKTWAGLRDYVLMYLAIHTGLRLSEIADLTLDSLAIYRGGMLVNCIGKGRKERCVFLDAEKTSVVRKWLEEVRQKGTKILFPTVRGNRMSADAIQYLVKKHVASASKTCASLEKKRISPHVFRHTYAMNQLERGRTVSDIALALGHESSSTTHIYLEAHQAFKEAALAKIQSGKGDKIARYSPPDELLAFLKAL